jgi:hypothetical protein
MPLTGQSLQDQINKRFTLNWLIQGAAQHAGMTFHHLIGDELDALNPRLLRLYDQYALINLLQYWHADAALILGWPTKFWKRSQTSRSHPFFKHPLLPKFGGMLAAAGRQRALERCKEKGLTRLPVLFAFQAYFLINRLRFLESRFKPQLIQLARRSASTIWGIPTDRLAAFYGKPARFGTPIRIRNVRAAIMISAMCGLGGVVQHGNQLQVVGAGTNWQLITKELVKGTADLICLHGLNTLDDETYRIVMDTADRIEYEPWMLQTGGELWRRLLTVIPQSPPIAQILMQLARLPPNSLHTLIEAVIEKPDFAREILATLGRQNQPELGD